VARLSRRQVAALVSNSFLTNGARVTKNLLTFFLGDKSAVTAIEYGLIVPLISVVCIEAMTTAGRSLLAVYNEIGGFLRGVLSLSRSGAVEVGAIAMVLLANAVTMTRFYGHC
jgi:Flp pilus assembly pilin Flp